MKIEDKHVFSDFVKIFENIKSESKQCKKLTSFITDYFKSFVNNIVE